jgi:hypothetical protein
VIDRRRVLVDRGTRPPIAGDEILGPVLSVLPSGDDDEAEAERSVAPPGREMSTGLPGPVRERS